MWIVTEISMIIQRTPKWLHDIWLCRLHEIVVHTKSVAVQEETKFEICYKLQMSNMTFCYDIALLDFFCDRMILYVYEIMWIQLIYLKRIIIEEVERLDIKFRQLWNSHSARFVIYVDSLQLFSLDLKYTIIV